MGEWLKQNPWIWIVLLILILAGLSLSFLGIALRAPPEVIVAL